MSDSEVTRYSMGIFCARTTVAKGVARLLLLSEIFLEIPAASVGGESIIER